MLSLLPHCIVGVLFVGSLVPILPYQYKNRCQLAAHLFLGIVHLFCPSCFLSVTVTGNFGSLHNFLQSFVAAFHLGIAYFVYASEDENAKPCRSLNFARLMTSFFCLFTKMFAAWHLSEKSTRGLLISDQFVLCAMLSEGVWFITELIRILLTKRNVQDEIDHMCKRTTLFLGGKGSIYLENALYIDSALSLTMAMLHFAFPQHILKLVIKSEHLLDSHHYMWSRLFGCLCLLPALASLQARHMAPHPQIAYLASRLVTQVIVFLLNVAGHWVMGVYSPNHITAFMISGFYMSFLFSVYYRMKGHYGEEANVIATTTRIETRTLKTKAN